MKRFFIQLMPWAILLACLVAVEYFWGWTTVLAAWQSLSGQTAVTLLCLMLASYALRAVRLYDFFRQAVTGRYGLCLRLMLYHNILNNLLPFRSGELSFPLLMKRYFGVNYLVSTPGLLLFRLFDLHVILTLGLIAVFTGVMDAGPSLIIGAIAGLIPFAVFSFRQPLNTWVVGQTSEASKFRVVVAALPESGWVFLRCWWWSWANWSVKLYALAWLIGEFAGVSLGAALGGAVIGELSSVLPINAPGNAGTYEAGIAVGLLPHGVSAERVVAAAVNTHLFVLLASAVGALLAWVLPFSKQTTWAEHDNE